MNTSSRPANPGMVLNICVAIGFTTLLDQAIFALALPALRDELQASTAQLQLIASTYSIAFGIALVPAGRLGDLIGRRMLLLLGLLLFAGFSLLAGLGRDASTVIVARLLQGLGAGIINTQILGLIQDLFHGPLRARALGHYISAGGLAGTLGPLFGGLILTLTPAAWGWRLLLLTNLPFALAVLLLAIRHLPPDHRPRTARLGFDGPGLALLSVTTLSLMLASLVGVHGLPSTQLCMISAALALLLFLVWEQRCRRRHRNPILGTELIRSPGYLLGTTVAMFQFAAGLTLGLVSTLFFLDGLGISPLLYALLSLPAGLGMMFTSSQSWRFVGRWGRSGVAAVIAVHIVLTMLEGSAIVLLPATAILWLWPAIGLLHGMASGLMHASNQALTLAQIGHDHGRGVAAGFLQLSQRLAASIGMSCGLGFFLAGLTPSSNLQTYRSAFAIALALVLALSAGALLAALADSVRRRANLCANPITHANHLD